MTYQSFDPYSAWDLAIDPEATGKAWRRKRKKNHLSQDGLSEIFIAVGMPMSKAAISAVENGKHLPSIHHAFLFAGLCECQVEDLVITYRRSRESDDLDQVVPLKFNIYINTDEHLRNVNARLFLTNNITASVFFSRKCVRMMADQHKPVPGSCLTPLI